MATVLAFLPWVIVAAGCWLGYQLVKQNGRILLQLEDLNNRLNQLAAAISSGSHAAEPQPSGLPVGSPAPEFDLPALDGGRLALQDFRGQRIVLTFFSPTCGFCQQMAPQLAALPANGGKQYPVPVFITTGDEEANRKLLRQPGINVPVGLQDSGELATRYQANGTPMGYLIDEEGNIASPVAVGSQALLELARQPVPAGSPSSQTAPNGDGHKLYAGNKPLSESHLNRNGLQPGTPAPPFTLPRLDGKNVSLADYRGQPLLLVFSDPGCGPCMELAPQLEDIHRRQSELKVLVVSRGEVAANEAKAREHHLSYPVVLQRHWEISKDYGMFGTPIAYLIDAQGRIAAPPASGAQAIVMLASSAAGVR